MEKKYFQIIGSNMCFVDLGNYVFFTFNLFGCFWTFQD